MSNEWTKIHNYPPKNIVVWICFFEVSSYVVCRAIWDGEQYSFPDRHNTTINPDDVAYWQLFQEPSMPLEVL